MKNNITIVIAGVPTSGKSTICHIIQKALNDKGIKNTSNDGLKVISTPDWLKQVSTVAKNTEVDIKIVQVARNGKLVI
jgi:adenylylsulfate kinase-like enzyme